MIKINNLTKKYGNYTAIDNLTLHIKKGEIFALLGLNGAGKSTTINILCSLIKKTSGQIFIDNLNLDTDAIKIKQIINLSPQETAIANNLTVKENLLFIADLYNITNKNEEITSLLTKFNLIKKEKSLAKTLSGGQKRKLSLAMALITKPKILILDEPTLGLDIKSRKELWEMIKEYNKNSTIILTTHYLEEAEQLADRIAILDKGKLSALGTVQEIINSSNSQNFESAFLKLTGEDENE